MTQFFVTGTDTGVGKTLVSAVLVKVLNGYYWKPIQSGLADDPADRDQVQSLNELPDEHFHDSNYQLQASLSPDQAAARENIEIDLQHCKCLQHHR